MSHARRARTSPLFKSTSRRRGAHRTRRLYEAERLELRSMMAGDVAMPFHNAFIPQDVNFDFSITPLDALLIINELNTTGPRALAPAAQDGGQGEQTQPTFIDVNNDGFLSPLDALGVINYLNAQGAATDVITVRTVVYGEDGETPLVPTGTDPVSGKPIYKINKGDRYSVAIEVQDNRPKTGPGVDPDFNTAALGVFTTYFDINYDGAASELAFSERQNLSLSATAPSQITLTVPNVTGPGGPTVTTGNIPIRAGTSQSVRDDNSEEIEDALSALLVSNGYAANSVRVTSSLSGGVPNYSIEFINSAAGVDFGLMTSNLISGTATASITSVFNPTGVDLSIKNNVVAALRYATGDASYSPTGDPTSTPGVRTFDVFIDQPGSTINSIMRVGGIASGDTSTSGDNVTAYMGNSNEYVRPTFIAHTATGPNGVDFTVGFPGSADDGNPDPSNDERTVSLLIGNTQGFDPKVPRDVIGYETDFILIVQGDIDAESDTNDQIVDSNGNPVVDKTILEDGPEVTIDVLANDDVIIATPPGSMVITGFGANGLAQTLSTPQGTLRIENNRVVFNPAYTAATPPTVDANGNYTFTFQYGVGFSNNLTDVKDIATVTLTIKEVNDPPVADNDTITVLEDAPEAIITSQLLDGDSSGVDPTSPAQGGVSDFLKIVSVTQGSRGGVVSVDANGVVRYTPPANKSGTETFTYTLSDTRATNALTTTATVTVNITPVNDPPSYDLAANHTSDEEAGLQTVNNFASNILPGPANADPQETDYNVTFVLERVSGDASLTFTSDPAISASTGAGNGGTLTYQAAANAHGTVTYRVIARDANNAAAGEKFFTITVNNINDAPEFTLPATHSSAEDAALQSVSITGITVGPNEATVTPAQSIQSLIVFSNSNPSLFSTIPAVGGYNSANGTATLTYKSADNAFGSATLVVRITDNLGAFTDHTITVTVTPVDDAPTAAPGTGVAPDGVATSIPVIANFVTDIDTPISGLTFVGSAPTILGTPRPATDVTVAYDTVTKSIVVTTRPGYFGAAAPDMQVEYQVTDGTSTVTGVLTVTFIPNRLPLAVDDIITGLVVEGGAEQTFNVISANDRALNNATANLTVTGISLNPNADPDVDADWLTDVNGSLVTPDGGVIEFAADGTIHYTPGADEFGNVVFYYRLDDPTAKAAHDLDPLVDYDGPDVGQVTVVVAAVNDAPSFDLTANPNQSPVDEVSAPTAVNVPGFAININNGAANETAQNATRFFTVEVVSISNPRITAAEFFTVPPAINPTTGELTYTIAPDAFGVVTLRVTLNDGDPTNPLTYPPVGSPLEFTITVNDVNDKPSFAIANPATAAEDAGAQSVTNFASSISPGKFEDPTGLTFTTPQQQSASSTLTFTTAPTISSNGTLTYQAAANAYGTATFTVQLQEPNGGLLSDPVTFTITITAVNDAPSFTLDPAETVNEDNSATASNPASPTTVVLQDVITGVDVGANEAGGAANEGGAQTVTFNITILSGADLIQGTPTIVAGSTAGARNISFQLKPNVHGEVKFRVTATDNPQVGTPITTAAQDITVTVTSINDAPTAVDDGPYRIFKTVTVSDPFNLIANDSSAPDAAENLTIGNRDANDNTRLNPTFVATPAAGSPAGAENGLFFTASADGKSVILHNPNGFFGTIVLTYTVQDPGGLTDTGIATFNVVNFLPGFISGKIWSDADNDGVIDSANPPYKAERMLGGIEVYVSGTTIFGQSFSTMVRTDALGNYSLNDPSLPNGGLIPGTYVVSLDNPNTPQVEGVELSIDGVDILGTASVNGQPAPANSVKSLGNNRVQVVFGEEGLTVTGLNFAIQGVTSQFVNIRDHVSNASSDGVVFGLNKGLEGTQQQYWYSNYESWNGTRCFVSMSGNDVFLSWDSGSQTHFVKLNLVTDWDKVRVMGTEGNNVVIRIVSSLPSLLSHSSHLSVAQITGGDSDYAQDVDDYFASHYGNY